PRRSARARSQRLSDRPPPSPSRPPAEPTMVSPSTASTPCFTTSPPSPKTPSRPPSRESPSDRIVAGLLDDVQFDDLLLEQAQTPTREPHGRRGAGQGDQFRFRRPVENPRPGGVRIVFAGQRRRHPFFDQSRPGAADIVYAGVQRRRDRAVAPTFARLRHVRLQQDARLRQRLRRMLARADHRLQPFALLAAHLPHILLDRKPPRPTPIAASLRQRFRKTPQIQ